MDYKSYRYIDGNARWIICDEEDNIISKNPTREQLKMAIFGNSPRKCYKCGNDKTYVDSFGRNNGVHQELMSDIKNNNLWDGTYQKVVRRR